jgi:methylenetetrahydrofolate reductase (NADH)
LKKIVAGSQFIQTNYIFDLPLFEKFMARIRDLGLDKRVYILAGVGPLASAKAGRWMRSNVPGIHIPDSIIERMERAQKPAEEGTRICIEIMQQIREIPGVAGIHVMAYRREHLVSEIVLRSGVRKARR